MRTTSVSLALFALLLFTGCAERRDSTSPEIQAHPESWADPGSADFHGERVLQRGPDGCATCHDLALDGIAKVPDCDQCHDGPGGHPYGWASPSSSDFHADAVAASGNDACALCHGESYQGEAWSGVSCYSCHGMGPSGHVDGWLNPVSLSFHGRKVRSDGPTDCRRCHGQDLAGGTSGVACADCHQ